ncbi:MAG TPA: hypothetical protein DCM14_02015 [Clostridiales bacterium UBA8153]|nr:hypothetical protein [Clostridiales bacterium UBA8153]
MHQARQHLAVLARTAVRDCYYSWVKLQQKVDVILDKAGVAALGGIDTQPASPEGKASLVLRFAMDEHAVAHRAGLESWRAPT